MIKKRSNENKKDKIISALRNEIKDKDEEIEFLNEANEAVKKPVEKMQDFQDKAMAYLFTLAVILAVFAFI